MRLCAYDLARDKRAFIASVVFDKWKEKAIAMAGQKSIPAIAKEVGKTARQVEWLFESNGIRPGKLRPYTDSMIRITARLTKEGVQRSEIAYRLDMTADQVDAMRRIAKRKGML